jgi:hypothetical protein
MVTPPQVPAEGLGATGDEIIHGAAVAGQKVVAEARLLSRSIAPAAVRHVWHAPAPTRWAIGQQGIDGGMHDVEGCAREMVRWVERAVGLGL